jgi:pimeloyl-ACP methyl ester carboxylesterase
MADALIYLHGGPGSPDELNLFGTNDLRADYAPDRFVMFASAHAAQAFDGLANDIATRFPDRPLHLIGFSMGGYAALELAKRLGARVAQIDLIAAAAPLEGGAFLDRMAGKPLFSIAQTLPGLLPLVMAAQRGLVRLAPGLAYKMLYANALGMDRALADDPVFKARIIRVLKQCYSAGAQGLTREIRAYVQPWGDILPQITAPTTIWHGTQDNWAPFAMADYLSSKLPSSTLNRIEGASHYSTLRDALSQIGRSPSGKHE